MRSTTSRSRIDGTRGWRDTTARRRPSTCTGRATKAAPGNRSASRLGIAAAADQRSSASPTASTVGWSLSVRTGRSGSFSGRTMAGGRGSTSLRGRQARFGRLRFRAWRRSASSRPPRDGWHAAGTGACTPATTAVTVGAARRSGFPTARTRASTSLGSSAEQVYRCDDRKSVADRDGAHEGGRILRYGRRRTGLVGAIDSPGCFMHPDSLLHRFVAGERRRRARVVDRGGPQSARRPGNQ
jgi:hypothetical protein